MNLHFISRILGASVLNSLWQGLMIFLLLKLIFFAMPAISSKSRYLLSLSALFFMTASFLVTLFNGISIHELDKPGSLAKSGYQLSYPAFPVAVEHSLMPEQTLDIFYRGLKFIFPYVSVLYLLGLSLTIARINWKWRQLKYVKKTSTAISKWQARVEELAITLQVKQAIRLQLNDFISVPCTFGYIKPIILLPVTMVTHLSPGEIETIFLHELIHIKNKGYLINIIQQTLLAILFFNPFAIVSIN